MLPRTRIPIDIAFIALVWLVWALGMSVGARWGLLIDNWFMSVTMVFGSFVAGSTSQGGGAVAFPVMTLGFGIDPKGARDFSLMIQSIGMTSAAVAIFWRRIPVEKTTLVVAGIAGAGGMIFGLEMAQWWFASHSAKVFFVSLWLAFGFALWRINHLKRPVRRTRIEDRSPRSIAFLALAGLLGGTISGVLGSGLDILVFAMLVLGFRLCETVATPTSVILMAANSLVGFAWRLIGGGGEPIRTEIWDYWWVCVPIVALGAPMGARFISKKGHQYVVRLLLFVILAQFVGALFIIPFTLELIELAVITFFVGIGVFTLVWRWGRRYV